MATLTVHCREVVNQACRSKVCRSSTSSDDRGILTKKNGKSPELKYRAQFSHPCLGISIQTGREVE